MKREPVAAVKAEDGQIRVVCNDGSVWVGNAYGWTEELPVPGTHADKARIYGGGE